MQLDMGSHVRTSDDKDAGKVKRLIFDGDSMTIRQFVVHEGFFFSDERMVEIEHIASIDDDHAVHLNLTEEQFKDTPAFVHERVDPQETGDYYFAPEVHDVVVRPGSVPWNLLVLSHGTDVYDSEGKHIGNLDEIAYEGDGRATAFIVEAGLIFTHDVTIPVHVIKSVTNDRVNLSITASEAEGK